MVWTFGAGPKIFLYESGVLVVGYSYGYFSNRDMMRVGAALSVVTALILLFLVPLYATDLAHGHGQRAARTRAGQRQRAQHGVHGRRQGQPGADAGHREPRRDLAVPGVDAGQRAPRE